MALVWKDRVLETTTTTGTGTLTLAGAVTGYQTFAAVGDGNTCYYCVYAVDAFGNPSGVWEVGLGTYTASGTTLARTTVYANSSGTQVALDLAAGTKRVMLTAAAQHLTTIPVANGGTGLTALGSALQVLRVNAGGTALEYGTLSTGLTVGTTAIASGTSGRLLYDAAGVLGETAAVTYATSTANLTVTASGAAVVPLAVKGAGSQSANLTEWQDSTGAVVASVSLLGGAIRLYPGPNFFVGDLAGNATLTGAENWCLGIRSGQVLTSGFGNLMIGSRSGQSITSGGYNVALGYYAMPAATTGNSNVAVGEGAGENLTTGGENVLIGAGSGKAGGGRAALTTGTHNVVLGRDAGVASASQSYGVALGYAAVAAANEFAIGPYCYSLLGHRLSSTSTVRPLVGMAWEWVDSTDATRKARATHNVYDTAARECIRLEASGSAAMLGLYGTAATVQYATTGTVTGYTGGGGTALTHSDTFTGNTGSTAYTIGDVVRALKLLGAIAA